ncbi:hypothetical protein TNCV_4491311 [Trichonephila clavipes]|nr:hypothetical protein TNCV_4491311 [Trichonephila clavipes]
MNEDSSVMDNANLWLFTEEQLSNTPSRKRIDEAKELSYRKKGNSIRIFKRNPDYCSVLPAELLAIEEALKFCFTECPYRYCDIE